MADYEFDVAVIGAGVGGYVAAIRAAQLGLKTVCIEKDKTLGGTCLNVGCIPSKALLQSTEYYDLLKHDAQQHGIACKELSFDFGKMQQRKEQIVQSLVNGVGGLLKKNSVTYLEGQAKFSSPASLEVKSQKETHAVKAKWFIAATGSQPVPLPFLPYDEKIVVSSTGALNFSAPPKRLLVIGAGVIGVELASVYKRLGSEVVIIEMLDRICPMMDKAISRGLLQILKKQGLLFHLSAKVTQGKVQNSSAALTVEIEGKAQDFIADAVLVAVGRRPYSEGLGLKEIGVEMSPKGFVKVDADFRTTLSHVFAIGDLIDGPMLAHRASEEGIAAAEIIAGMRPHINYMGIPNVIYTHPEAAAVGLTEEEALAKGLKLKIGTCLFRGIGRARCMGYTEGMVKVIAEARSERLIGVHILGPHASEMIGEGVIAIDKQCTLQDMVQSSHAHPTLSEAILEACLSALGRTINT